MQAGAPDIPRVDNVDKALLAWFAPSSTPIASRKPFGEIDLRGISDVLRRTGRDPWSRIPRIYATLRIINQLPAIDDFLTQGLSDIWFPFSQKSLPASLKSQAARFNFLEAQRLVLSKGLDLEKEDGRHRHFSNPADIPFQKVAELGKGGFGYVDRVLSTISYTEYARKLIPRGRTFRKDQEVLRDFEKELGTLKKLSHIHIVELVGSYTDPRFVGIIMSPVADYNLKEFLDLDPLPPESHSFLRTFFGCLTAALKYLHENRIRHKDIKPQNVLVKAHQVLLTDFGISRDWSELDHSTTTGPTTITPRYSAPEVAAYEPRNSLADIWSLGCVFLEIWSVLCGETTSNLTKYMTTSGSCSQSYYQNLDGIASWCNMMRPKPEEDQHLEQPYFWIRSMLEVKPRDRCNIQTLFDRIQETNADPNIPVIFTGTCCVEDEHSAESVQSSIFEHDITDTTNVSSTIIPLDVSTLELPENPTIQPISYPDAASALEIKQEPPWRQSPGLQNPEWSYPGDGYNTISTGILAPTDYSQTDLERQLLSLQRTQPRREGQSDQLHIHTNQLQQEPPRRLSPGLQGPEWSYPSDTVEMTYTGMSSSPSRPFYSLFSPHLVYDEFPSLSLESDPWTPFSPAIRNNEFPSISLESDPRNSEGHAMENHEPT